MRTERNTIRAQWILLGLTALFLCLVSALYLHDRADFGVPSGVEAETTVPMEEIQPDVHPLNLNAASAEELTTLPGIGEALARRILDYRTENGPFQAVEDLLNVSGIGEAKLAGLEGLVTVEEPVE